jgi:hypothetical protein
VGSSLGIRLERRRFDHLMLEISLALDRYVPRYPVWLALKEMGADPDRLSRANALAFCDAHLDQLVAHLDQALSPRQARRLRRSVARFDPDLLTPYEHMERIGSSD